MEALEIQGLKKLRIFQLLKEGNFPIDTLFKRWTVFEGK